MAYRFFFIGGMLAAVSFTLVAETAQPTVPPAPAEGATQPPAQELKPGSPEWVAREYLTAVRKRGFSAEAEFLHPEEIARFKSLLVPVFEAESEVGGRALMNATFGRDARMSEIRSADPADFLRRFSRIMAVRLPDQPTDYDRLWVLGSVKEKERVHVLVRLSSAAQADTGERLEVVSLLPLAEGWKLMLSPKLESAARAMNRSGIRERPAPLLAPRLEPPATLSPEPPAPMSQQPPTPLQQQPTVTTPSPGPADMPSEVKPPTPPR
jgi:hypothetical protein